MGNPNLESNPRKLNEEVLSAKDYIKQLRSALPAYSNVATLKSAIFDTEATIAVNEDVVTRRTKETDFHAANSRKEKSASTAIDSGRTSSRDIFSQEIEDKEREKRTRKRKQEDTPGGSDTPDLMDRLMKIKMRKSNAPLTSTPAGQYTVKKSMKPLSSLVGVSRRGGDDDPHGSDDGSDHDDDDDDGNEGRKGRDRDDDDGSRRGRDYDRSRKRKRSRSRSRDTGSRRSRSRSRGSRCITAVPKMPNLDPRNFFWTGNTAFLRYYIEKWRKLLDPSNYSAAQAINFMLQCVPGDRQYIINDCTSLDEISNKLSTYTTDEEIYLLKTINDIKSYGKPSTYREDRTMLDFFDRSLSNITKLNCAFVLDYLTAQIMCNKLSHDSMRTKYIDMLTDLKIRTGDNHKVNNYLSTMKQIIVKCKVEIENMVDVNQGDQASNKETDNALVYTTQTHGSGYESRGHYNSYRGNQGSHYNKHRGGYQSYKDNRKPINLDDRGNYLWDFDGNPF